MKIGKKSFLEELKQGRFFYLLVIPGLVWLIMFCYLPMAGLYIVFERYTYQGGLFGSQFVGLQNFKFFFSNMDNALRATRNTLVINGASIILGTIVNVTLAIAVNDIGNSSYRKVTQSIMLFPHFISWIVIGMISLTLFDEKGGLFNQLLTVLGTEAVPWYAKPGYWQPILVLSNVWKGAGYGSIIYYAALTGFDQSLYEAADIDGANRMQKILKITLPLLKPTVIIMFLLNIGGILFGSVDQIMGLTNLNPLLLETTDTIATFVYRSAIVNGQFESASAITLYQSVFGFLLVMGANALIRKIEPDHALF
jgi:putative aldouronate transport system permease protein